MGNLVLLLWLSFCAGGVLLAADAPKIGEKESPNVAKLVAEATARIRTVDGYNLLKKSPLADRDVPEALAYIRKHDDYSSFYVLLAVRKYYAASYRHVPNEVKSGILCSALKNMPLLNDFGELGRGAADVWADDADGALALRETGKEALKWLQPMLDDDRPAPLGGSDEAKASLDDKYRRKDYAYRFASLILGKTPAFQADPKKRDKDIEILKAELKRGVPVK
jgi:hypothetical protein